MTPPLVAPVGASQFAGSRRIPAPVNEPVRNYAPNSPERTELQARLASMAAERIEIPVVIGGKRIYTSDAATKGVYTVSGRVI